MRKLIGFGKPRRLQGAAAPEFALLCAFWGWAEAIWTPMTTGGPRISNLPVACCAA